MLFSSEAFTKHSAIYLDLNQSADYLQVVEVAPHQR